MSKLPSVPELVNAITSCQNVIMALQKAVLSHKAAIEEIRSTTSTKIAKLELAIASKANASYVEHNEAATVDDPDLVDGEQYVD